MTEINELFSTENRYKLKQERQRSNRPNGNQIVIGVHERVSTNRQAVEGDSLEMQSELAQKHAQKIGGVIFKYYTEEGLSAKKTELKDRNVMQEIIHDIEEGNINYLIAYRRDRLFRNQAENMWFWALLAEHDCQIYLTATGESQVKVEELKKAGTTKMMESILAMMSEMESEITSTRVADVMLSKAQRGEYTGGSLPIGYERNVEGHFIPKIGVKALVTTVENLYLQGYGLHSIARFLNGDQVNGLPQLERPVNKPIEGDKSDVWNHRNINTMLFSPFYTGHLSFESKKNLDASRVIKKVDYIEPVRTLERQKQLNAFKNNKTASTKSPRSYNTPFLLSGLLYCEECGEKMLTQTSQPKNSSKRFSYYRCANKMGHYKSKGCSNQGYRKEILEALVTKITKEKIKELVSDNYLQKLNEKIKLSELTQVSEQKKIEKEIKSNEKIISNLTKIITLTENEDLQITYLKEQEVAMNEIKKLKLRLSELENAENKQDRKFDLQEFYDLANQYGEAPDASPVPVQKQLIELLFSKIKINNKGEVSVQVRNAVAEILDLSSSDVDDSQDEVFIGFGTGGSPLVIKDINSLKEAVSKFTVTFNYFEYPKAIAEHFYSNLKQFVFLSKPELNPQNKVNVDYANLANLNIAHFKDELRIKMHILNRYFEQVGGVSSYTFRNFYSGAAIKLNDVYKIFELAHTDIQDYFDYLKDVDNDLTITNMEALESILFVYSPKKERSSTEHLLFRDVVFCQCGNKAIRKINRTSPVSYYCVSKDKKYKLTPCEFKATQEQILIDKIKQDKGIQVCSKSDVNNLVRKIVIENRHDFTIYYK